jgi:hypothetical protein
VAGEHFKERSVATRLDDRIDFVRLSGVLPLSRGQKVHLSSPRRRSAHASANAEENQFGHIPEVKANPTPVRATVLTDFVPNDVGFVCKPPPLHYLEALKDQRLWNSGLNLTLVRQAVAIGVEPSAVADRRLHLSRMEDRNRVIELPSFHPNAVESERLYSCDYFQVLKDLPVRVVITA